MDTGEIKSRSRSLWSWLRNPRSAIKEQVEDAEHRLEALEKHFRENLRHRLGVLLGRCALGAVFFALALVGGAYFLLGLWFAFNKLFGPIIASFALAVSFVGASLIPLLVLYTMIRGSKNSQLK